MTRALVLPRLFRIVFCVQMTLLASALSVTLEEALDAPALSWRGSPGWEGIATAAARDGVDAAQASSAADVNPRLETTVVGPGYLTFWWQITSGDDEGAILLEVDGIEFLTKTSDAFVWEQVGINLPPGNHTVAIVLRPDSANLVAQVDQAIWSPGEKLPAAVALDDPDGFWVQQGEWQRVIGESRDGVGDADRVNHPGGSAAVILARVLSGPATVRFWQKIATTRPEQYAGVDGQPLPETWMQKTVVVSGKPGFPSILRLFAYGRDATVPATVWMDELEILPLSFAAAVDLPDGVPQFSTGAGSAGWIVTGDEADARFTGAVEVLPGNPQGSADVTAEFQGAGLLTWSWRKWSDLDETMTVSANGSVLGVFDSDFDYSINFAHLGRLLGNGVNFVRWHFQWGDNGFNPMALDDILFSPSAAPGIREAVELSPGAALYSTANTAWTPQSVVTHDGIDALELPVAGNGSRAALTLPVTGPGILTWWWRSESDAGRAEELAAGGAAFRLHRQGREVRAIGGRSGWRQEYLALRAGEEFVRWEIFLGDSEPGVADRVWLDQVAFVPQNVSVGEAVGAPNNVWSSTGDVLAATLPAPESHDGTDVVIITGPQNTKLPRPSVQSSFVGPGTLTFWARTQRGTADYSFGSSLLVDGVYQALVHVPSNDGWNAFSLRIGAGTHTVQWTTETDFVLMLDEVVFVAGAGYAMWAETFIPAGQPSQPNDDPDRDGRPNLLEYGFGTRPFDASSASGPSVRTLPNGNVVAEFVRDIRHLDVTLTAEISEDLISWQPVSTVAVAKDGFFETRRVADLPAGRAFFRIRVTQVP